MKILGFVIKFLNAFYTAIGPDIKNKKAIGMKESLSNQYLHWAPKLQDNEDLLTDVVSAILFLWLLCLIFILTILRPLVSEKHLVYLAVSSDGAFILYILFFGRWTTEKLKKDLYRISRSYLKFFAIVFVILNILLFLIISIYAKSISLFEQVASFNFKLVSIFVLLYISLTLILRLLPFFILRSSIKVVKYSITQSLKQESNQLGHFLRYIGWPTLLISLLQGVLLFF